MWDQDGMWRPQDYSLHNTYHQISNRPTEEQKIQYIDNLFNTILERAHSRANFSDLRAEIVDHYISELGNDFEIEDGLQFRQKVYDYHKKFGGPDRVVKIAGNFLKAKNKLIRRQFGNWFLKCWYVHLSLSPILIYSYWFIDPIYVIIAFTLISVVVCSYEGIKYIKSRKVRAQAKTGESSVNFFFQYKLEVFSVLWLPLQFLHFGVNSNASPFAHLILIVALYYFIWTYYYHINICQKRIAPLLDHYKAQMI